MAALIELTGITYGHPGRPHVLENASLQVNAGERLCITGHNGAGKSTLLHVMLGLFKPEAGKIMAFGQERHEERDFLEVRRRAGLVFQDPDDQLFCPTVADDIAFGPLNLGKSRDEAAAIVDHVLDQLDCAYLRDRVTHRLSGGEKRLITLAAVLAMEPDILLLDEPTNALDENRWQEVTDILSSLPQTMVFVSHDPKFRAALATRTLALKDGQLIAA